MKTIPSVCIRLGLLLTLTLVSSAIAMSLHWRSLSRAKTKLPEPAVSAALQGERVNVRLLRIEGTGEQTGPQCFKTLPPVNTTQAQVSVPLPFDCSVFQESFNGQIQLQVPTTMSGALDQSGRLTPDPAVAPSLSVSGGFSADPNLSRGVQLLANINGDNAREVCDQFQRKTVDRGGSTSLALNLNECTLRLIPPRGSNFVVTFFASFDLFNSEFTSRSGGSVFRFEAIYERVDCPASDRQGASQICPVVDLNKSTFTTGVIEEKKVGTLDSAFFRIKAVDSQDRPVPNRSAQIEVVRRCLNQPEQRRTITLPNTDAQGESRIDAVRELAPGEYEYIAKIDGAQLTNAQASYKYIWLGPPDPGQSTITLRTVDSPAATTIWANRDDKLTVEVKICDACGRYPQKQNETGLPVGLRITGPDNSEEPFKETDRNGIVTFTDITFDKPGNYKIESLVLGEPLNSANLRAKPAPRVENFEIIQAITLPFAEQTSFLVENKETVLRLFVKNRDTDNANVEVKLRVFSGQTLLRELVAQPTSGPRTLPPNNTYIRTNLNNTYNFMLPPDLAKGAIGIEVVQTPKEHPNDKEPRKELTFHRRTLTVRYVLFEVNGNKPDAVAAANASGLLQRIWPVSKLDYQPLDLVVRQKTVAPSEYAGANVNLNPDLEQILSGLSAPKPDILFGFYQHPSRCQGSGNWDKALQGGAFIIRGLKAPTAYSSIVPGCTQKVLPHESGHDYLLSHPRDIGVLGVATPPERTEDLGIDTTGGWRLRQNDWEVMNQGLGDNDVWISQFSWKHLFNRLPGSGAIQNRLRKSIGQPNPLLFISGSVFLDGRANLDPIFPSSSALNPGSDGPYCLRLEDAVGQSLFNRCFNISEFDDNFQPRDPAPFSETVPQPAGLARVVLTREGQVLAERRASPNAPTVAITSPAPGEFWDGVRTAQWTAQDSDGDPLSYLIQYSPDDRQSWFPLESDLKVQQYALDTNAVPGGDRFWLRVVATDGLNFATAEAGPIRLPKKGPQVFITGPQQDTALIPNLPVILQGIGLDLEDGGLSEESLTWTSDRDGNLGSGSLLQVASLSVGTHRITLSGQDRDGNTTTTSVIVHSSLNVPVMAVLPATRHFGYVMIGQSLETNLTVSNTGNAPLTVNSITSDNPRFSVTSPATPFTVPVGATTSVTVRFTPSSESAQTGTLSFVSNDPNRPSINVTLEGIGAARLGKATSVSAASFSDLSLAPEAIAAAFGTGLATATSAASTIPLPTSLAGTTVKVRDSAGNERLAPLFFVSPNQINYQIPPGTIAGAATVTVTSGDGALSTGDVSIAETAPGLFAANANGQGAAAATVLRVRADGSRSFEPVAVFDPARNLFVATPIDLGPDSDQLFLILFGTGWRFRSSLPAVTCGIGGVNSEVLFAGAQGDFVGLDQMNVRLARSLAGRGEVDVVVIVDGKPANTVRINVK
ncbi:MAG: choice-of-anchor D domain-containing protein [Blastocatellales bacterium]